MLFISFIGLTKSFSLYTYIVNSLKIFDVITAVVLLIGASVGGVISLLLPEITRGLILGFLVGLYADAVCIYLLFLVQSPNF